MAVVLERATLTLSRSRDEGGLDPLLYVINPNLAPVTVNGVLTPTKYWILTGDVLSLKTRAQMDAADAAELLAAQTRVKAQIDATTQWYLDLQAVLAKSAAQIQADGVTQKAAVDALATVAAVDTYQDPRPTPPNRVR